MSPGPDPAQPLQVLVVKELYSPLGIVNRIHGSHLYSRTGISRDLYSLYSAVNLIVLLRHVLLSLAVGAVAVDILTRISAIESPSLKRGTHKYFSVLVSILCLLTVCQSVSKVLQFPAIR